MNLHGNRGETIVSCVESPGMTRVKVVPGGRLPRRKLEKRLAKAQSGGSDGQ